MTGNRKTIRSGVLLAALAFDWAFGDPPNRFHPTAWMGSLISTLYRLHPKKGKACPFVFGALLTTGGAATCGSLGWLFGRCADRLDGSGWLRLVLEALLLKTTFSLRGLDRAAGEVQAALEQEDLPEARRLVSWHLVSRDTAQLDASHVAAAAIESVAENASDSLVAPLFYYLVGGLPAALAYRFCNTADAMLGYHDQEHEWLGKAPARLDDALNVLPARVTGLLVALAAWITGENGATALKIMRRDARQTTSPNAGYPMSAMAGALGVELEKVGYYRLGTGGRMPTVRDLGRSRRILRGLAFLGGMIGVAMGCRTVLKSKKVL